MMREIIDHPRVSEEMKTFVKEMWSASAKTPTAVADAAREAGTYYLAEKLVANRGLISKVMKPGYVVSNWGKFKDLYVPKDVELELQAISKIPRIARGIYNKWFLSPWKMSKTITRPAYHARNLLSNLILNDWGGLPFYRWDIYKEAFKDLRNNGPWWRELKPQIGGAVNFSQVDLYQLEGGLKYGASMWDKMYSVFEKVAQPGRGLQQAEENWFKLAKYIHNRKELKMKPAEAALDAMKWTFNYGEVTVPTAQLRKWIAPFATWYTKAIPLMAETAVKHPIRFWKWVAFGAALQNYAMEQVGISDGEWASIEKTLPNYIRSGLFLMMPWRDQQGRLQLLNLTYIVPGIGDVNELHSMFAERGLQVPNPVISIAAALQSKRKFSGAPLYYEWEPGATKFAKAMTYTLEQLMPAITPGVGTDWNTLWKALQEEEGAPSVEQALMSWLGFKLTPVEPAALARRKEAIRKIHESEISLQMQKELRKARSGKETNRILEKYQRIRESEVNP